MVYKKILKITLLVALGVALCMPIYSNDVAAADVVTIDSTNFPDENFRTWVSDNADSDDNMILSDSEINNCIVIDVSNSGILDLTGIEYFTEVSDLNFDNNKVGSVDLSYNKKLSRLSCIGNELTELDVFENSQLIYLMCSDNNIEKLDISNLQDLNVLLCNDNNLNELYFGFITHLTIIHCQNNNLTELKLNNFNNLSILDCSNNQLNSIDFDEINLVSLFCNDNNLTSLDLSNKRSLNFLSCQNNNITELDLSSCKFLIYINCYNNALTNLDLSGFDRLKELNCGNNQISTLDVSNSTKLVNLSCQNNNMSSLSFDTDGVKYFVYYGNDYDVTGLEGLDEIKYFIQDDNSNMVYHCDYDNEQSTALQHKYVNNGVMVDTIQKIYFDESDFQAEVGDILSLPICLKSQNGTVYNETEIQGLKWESDDETVATVSDKGVIQCIKEGDVTITVRALAYPEGSNDAEELSAVVSVIVSESTDVEINDINFPDENFRSWVSDTADMDSNGSLSQDEIAARTTIFVSNMEISDLSGIEYFTELDSLYADSNNLTSLDLSENTKLMRLSCRNNNQLADLNLQNCSKLEYLDCSNNAIYVLDLSDCTKLLDLICHNNNMSELVLGSNSLCYLAFYGNEIDAEEINGVSNIKNVITTNDSYLIYYTGHFNKTEPCYRNVRGGALGPKIVSIKIEEDNYNKNIDDNFNLVVIMTDETQIEHTDKKLLGLTWTTSDDTVCTVSSLGEINCIGEGEATIQLVASTSPESGSGVAEIKASCNIKVESSQTTNIVLNDTEFPDELFRNWVSENVDTDNDGILSESEINSCKKIDVKDLGITDLTGIKYFTSITYLYCQNNALTELDLSSNTKLVHVECYNNKISDMAPLNSDSMLYLDCSDNELDNIDLSNAENIHTLYCQNNNISQLDIDDLNLQKLNCANNKLTSLNLTNSTDLRELYCQNNKITIIYIDTCKYLKYIDCSYNLISVLRLDGFSNLIDLDCSNNELTTLEFSGNTKLTYLDCTNNLLEQLDVSSLSSYVNAIYCGNNKLTKLDLSKNTYLVDLSCHNNGMEELILNSKCLKYFVYYGNVLDINDIDGIVNIENIILSPEAYIIFYDVNRSINNNGVYYRHMYVKDGTLIAPVDSITFSSKVYTVSQGGTLALPIKIITVDNNIYLESGINKLVWTSNNKDIATVSDTGLVNGISKGTITVVATAPGGDGTNGEEKKVASCTLNVTGSTDQDNDNPGGGNDEDDSDNPGGGNDEDDNDNSCGHTPVIMPAVKATCTTNGLTEGLKCSKCGLIIVEQEVVDATGHKSVVDEAIPSTTTSVGLSKGAHCSECGYIIVPQTETPKRLSNCWLVDWQNWLYLDENGNQVVSSWKEIDSKMYYFNEQGYRVTGWNEIDGKLYYMNPDGDMADGWTNIGGKIYYFNPQGTKLTGWILMDGISYYVDQTGVRTTGWLKLQDNWYYFDQDGKMVTGWAYVDNDWYYMNSSGVMQTGWYNDGYDWYYLDYSGAMVTGWLLDGGSWYYLNSSGRMVVGWVKDCEKWYYLNNSGAMVTGWLLDVNEWYYLSPSGAMVTDWINLDDEWYYLKPSGKMATGWEHIKGKWYYMYDSGKMAHDTNIGVYKLGSDGAMK